MHFYSLPLLKPPLKIINSQRHHREQGQGIVSIHTSIKQNNFYGCAKTFLDSFIIWRVNLTTKNRIQKQLRFKIRNIKKSFLCKNILIIQTDKGDIACINIQNIFQKFKLSIVHLEKPHFSQFFTLLADKSHIKQFRPLLVQEQLVGVYLINYSIEFRQIDKQVEKKLKISAWDLGYGNNDKISAYSICQQLEFDNIYSDQLIIVAVRIQRQTGQLVYVLIQILWRQCRYISSQVYAEQASTINIHSKLVICALGKFLFAVYIGNWLAICQKVPQGLNVIGLVPLQQQIQSMVGIQTSDSMKILKLITLTKSATKKVLYCYNITRMIKNLIVDPVKVNSDKSITDLNGGFVKLSSDCILLAQKTDVLYLSNAILKLYSVIINCQITDEDTNQNQIQTQVIYESNCEQINQQTVIFLPHQSFTRLIKDRTQLQGGISEVFSLKKVKANVDNFQNKLQNTIPCLKNNSLIWISGLLREYTLILIYLLHYLKYLRSETNQIPRKIAFNRKYFLQEILLAYQQNYKYVPLVQEPMIQNLVNKKLINLKDNIMSVLALFSRSSNTMHSRSEKSNHLAYYPIISQLSVTEILEFFTDHASLINHLIFSIYKAGVMGNYVDWSLNKRLLSQIIKMRKDYPPLIGLIIDDIQLYAINNHHLQICKRLKTREKQDVFTQLSNLPSLRQISAAPFNYLKMIGYNNLICFVPEQLQKIQFQGNFLVIYIPKKYRQFAEDVLKNQLIDIKGVNYLYLSQQNLSKIKQNIQSQIKVPFCIHSRCPNYYLSQRLKIIHQIFIIRLIENFKQKKALRQQNRLIKYNCKCFQNQDYQKLFSLQQSQNKKQQLKSYMPKKIISKVGTQKMKCQSNLDAHNEIKIIDKYINNLMLVTQQFGLYKFHDFLKGNKLVKQKSAIFQIDNIQKLEISRIKPSQTFKYDRIQSNRQQNQTQQYYYVIFQRLWQFYDRLAEIKQNHYQVDEQLRFSQFSDLFIRTITFINTIISIHFNNQISTFHRNNKTGCKLFQTIRKCYKQHQKFTISLRKIEDIPLSRKKAMINIFKHQLILGCYPKTQDWIYGLDDLILQSALNNVMLSENSKNFLQNLIQFKQL